MVCRGIGLSSSHVEKRGFESLPLGLVSGQGSFPPLWGQLGAGWRKARGEESRKNGELPVPRPEMPE